MYKNIINKKKRKKMASFNPPFTVPDVDEYLSNIFVNSSTVEEYLREKTPDGKSSAISIGEQLVVFKNGSFEYIDNQMTKELIKSTINRTQQFELAVERATIHYGIGNPITNRTFATIPNEGITIPFSSFVQVMGLTKRIPTYYDLGCFCKSQNVNYSSREASNIRHSGDRNKDIHLLQYVNLTNNNNKKIGVIVSGYSGKTLSEYREHQPFVVISTISENWIIPIPLDPASIGSAKMCMPCVIVVENDKIFIKPLNVVIKSNSYVTDGPSEEMKSIVNQTRFEDVERSVEISATVSAPASVPEKNDQKESSKPSSYVDINGPIVISDKDINVKEFMPDFKFVGQIKFKQSPTFYVGDVYNTDFHTEDLTESDFGKNNISCPVLSGEVNGPPSTLMTNPVPKMNPNATFEQFNEAYIKNNFQVVIINEDSNEPLQTGNYRVQGVIIYKIDKVPEFIGGIPTSEFMNEINQTGINQWAAPNSIIVTAIKNHQDTYNFYYLGGIMNNLLIPMKCKYGQSLGNTEEFTLKLNNLISTGILINDKLVNVSDISKIKFNNDDCEISDFIAMFESVNFDFFQTYQWEVVNVIEQFKRIYNTNELKKIMTKFISILEKHVLKAKINLKKRDCDDLMNLDEEKIAMIKAQKSEQTRRKNVIKTLIEVVSSAMISSKDKHSEGMTLKQINKQNKISANVDAVKEIMDDFTGDKFEDFMEDYDEHGAIVMEVNIVPPYESIKRNTFLQNGIIPFIESNFISPSPRTPYIDSTTTAVLSMTCCSNQEYQQHELSVSNMSLFIPNSNRSKSCIMIPVANTAINLKDPFYNSWPNTADKKEFAHLRILLSSNLTKNLSSRAYSLSPSSLEIRWLVASTFMNAMININKPSSEEAIDFDSSICKTMRGLMTQFLASTASGQNPICFVWQLISNSRPTQLPKCEHEWFVLKKMCELWKYTGWDDKKLKFQLIKFITRIINKNVDAATKHLKEEVKQAKSDEKNQMPNIFHINFTWFDAYKKIVYHILSKQTQGFIDQIEYKYLWTIGPVKKSMQQIFDENQINDGELGALINILDERPNRGQNVRYAIKNPEYITSSTTQKTLIGCFHKHMNPFKKIAKKLYMASSNEGIQLETFTEIVAKFETCKEFKNKKDDAQFRIIEDKIKSSKRNGHFVKIANIHNIFDEKRYIPKKVSQEEVKQYIDTYGELEGLEFDKQYIKGWKAFTIPPGINSSSYKATAKEEASEGDEESPLEMVLKNIKIVTTPQSRTICSFLDDPDTMSLGAIVEQCNVRASDFKDIFKFTFTKSNSKIMIEIMTEIIGFCVLNWDTENQVIESQIVDIFKDKI